MRKLLAFASMLGLCSSAAMAEGIVFHDITLSEALDVAAKENKLVFVDCYTPSCGPCKFMADKIFPLDECGEYINPKFVSIKKDLEADDNRYIAEQYKVMIYPTFLFLNPDGSIFYKQEGGASRTADKFLERMSHVMSIGECNARYEAGERSVDFIVSYINELSGFNNAMLYQLLNSYVPTLSVAQLSTPELWDAISRNISSPDIEAYRRLFDLRGELSDVIGKDTLSSLFSNIYATEYRQKKNMIRDFSVRISDIRTLESEGLIAPSLLSQAMTIRQIINNKLEDKTGDMVAAINEIGISTFTDSDKLAAIADVPSVASFASSESKADIKNALRKLSDGISETSRGDIDKIIARL